MRASITDTHQHIGMIYWARRKTGQLKLAAAEHRDIGWFGAAQLKSLEPAITFPIEWYCLKALEEAI